MEMKLFLELYDELTEKRKEILRCKNHDYAKESDVFQNFRIISTIAGIPIPQVFMVFIGVKIARLTELLSSGKEAKNESVQDTLLDLANYADLLNIYLKGEDK